MSIIQIILLILLGFGYSISTCIGAILGVSKRKIGLLSGMVMVCSGILVLGSLVCKIFLGVHALYSFVVGLILIQMMAGINGLKMNKKINGKHHLVRLLIGISILVLFLVE